MTDFAPRSELAQRPPVDVPLVEQVDELAQSVAERAEWFARDLARGKITADRIARHTAIWAAIVADHAGLAAAGCAHGIDAPGVTWSDRIGELRRELAIRRNAWPKRIGKTHGMTACQAARRLECLDAAYHRYWARLFAFSPAGVAPHHDPLRIFEIARREQARARTRADRARTRAAPPSQSLLAEPTFHDRAATPKDPESDRLRTAARQWATIATHAESIALQETGLCGSADRIDAIGQMLEFAYARLLTAIDRGDSLATLHRATVDRWLIDQLNGERAIAAMKAAAQPQRKMAA